MFKNYVKIFAALLIVSSALIYIDYHNVIEPNSDSLFASILDTVISPSSINSKTLSKTSLKDENLEKLSQNPQLFPPYLDLPTDIKNSRYSISSSSIVITEMRSKDPAKTIKYFLNQDSEDYKFNQINDNTFYLNQQPAEAKTHNFLCIAIHDILYGFQYQPSEHRKVLEIIDALQEND